MKIRACPEHQHLDGLEATPTEQDRPGGFFSCDLVKGYREGKNYLLGYSCQDCMWDGRPIDVTQGEKGGE